METIKLKYLLDQVKALNDRYKKINELTGENFNVFRILKLESSEVRMHSAFLAELLNPNGSHGQKGTFLKLFLKSFCFKNNTIDPESCKVEIEKHTGFISEDGTEGGRIDIVITDKYNHQIIIENKIYAGDQANQLYRYHKYSPKADLIYLTLEGNEPSDLSKNELHIDIDFKCYSYAYHIAEWLELCRKEVVMLPIIRESITQYLNLIKYLTNQTLNDTMAEELYTLLVSNLESSFIIADNLKQSLTKLIDKLDTELITIAKELGLNYDNNVDFKGNYTGFWFWKDEWKHVNFGFQFWSKNRDFIYGVVAKQDPNMTPIPLYLIEELQLIRNNSLRSNLWWPFYEKIQAPLDNWAKYDAWKAIEDGSMKFAMKEKIEYLFKVTQGIIL
ncbi:PD-(D/E)XK nuclease superfamily protein [Mucilaginibacter oryzae]|uniref:PD-(D/E)XK nuclease superfamily protein n=1 Tax=Mucilaginibacter oryzae TaxID=468058 RepID=A0A316HJL5_9SPHI|nr:PD-(D/E)XK nuclease family protein [Mucilaginibacter oryzae]PWK80240.1 PD-(D/E)XK nuclease superfamily protein [Mucilaginibacter oryzae]